MRAIIIRMAFFTYDTVRARTAALLDANRQPLTAAYVADQINTTPLQARRALRELERRGTAVRAKQTGRPGQRGGRLPDQWSAARP